MQYQHDAPIKIAVNQVLNFPNSTGALKAEIPGRAAAALSHFNSGNYARAEELACEVDALQNAGIAWKKARAPKDVRHLFPDIDAAPEGEETWKLSIGIWANIAVHGYSVTRYFTMPFGVTLGEASLRASRLFRVYVSDRDVEPLNHLVSIQRWAAE